MGAISYLMGVSLMDDIGGNAILSERANGKIIWGNNGPATVVSTHLSFSFQCTKVMKWQERQLLVDL
jgi:hypothetical protein